MINFNNQDIFVPLLIEIQKNLKDAFAVILPEKHFAMTFASIPNWDDPTTHIRDWMRTIHPDASVIIVLEK